MCPICRYVQVEVDVSAVQCRNQSGKRFCLMWTWCRPCVLFRTKIKSRAVWQDGSIYYTLGNFLKPLAAIILPKLPTFLCNFLYRSMIFLVKSFLGNFYRHLVTSYWSHWLTWYMLLLLHCIGYKLTQWLRSLVDLFESCLEGCWFKSTIFFHFNKMI